MIWIILVPMIFLIVGFLFWTILDGLLWLFGTAKTRLELQRGWTRDLSIMGVGETLFVLAAGIICVSYWLLAL